MLVLFFFFISKKDIKLFLGIKRILKKEGINMKKLKSKMMLKDFIIYWEENIATYRLSRTTLFKDKSIIEKRILPFLGEMKLNKIDEKIIREFLNKQFDSQTLFTYQKNHTISVSTLKRIKAVLSGILQSAYSIGLIKYNPCRRVDFYYQNRKTNLNGKSALNFYSIETYKKVLNLLEKEPLSNRLIIELALKTGLRKSEIFGLTWEDVDFDNKIIRVNKSRQYLPKIGMITKETKNESSVRNIIIGDSLLILLKKFYKEQNGLSNFIFDNISFYGISEWFKRWQIKNNITPIRFHDLRHTHATLLLALGVDIKTISKRLGHSSIVTTLNIYTHVLESLDKSAVNQLEELENK